MKNATNPKGETQLELKISGDGYSFEFNALNYDYLSVNGAKAIYKGLGKTIINDVEYGGWAFIMTVIDGQADGGGGIDRIRLKIYNKNTGEIIYDNQPGDSETADPVTATDDPQNAIVVVNSGKKSAEIIPVHADFNKPVLKVYPNPFSEKLQFEFISNISAQARIDIYDMTGRLVKTVLNNPVEPGIKYNAEFNPTTISGACIYFYRMTTGNEVFNGKVLFKN